MQAIHTQHFTDTGDPPEQLGRCLAFVSNAWGEMRAGFKDLEPSILSLEPIFFDSPTTKRGEEAVGQKVLTSIHPCKLYFRLFCMPTCCLHPFPKLLGKRSPHQGWSSSLPALLSLALLPDTQARLARRKGYRSKL